MSGQTEDITSMGTETSNIHLSSYEELPSTLQIEITSCCNMACPMCPLALQKTLSSRSAGQITNKTWRNILSIAKRVRSVVIVGYGEPFTHPRCLRLLRTLNRFRVHMGIATNGVLLTRNIAKALAKIPYLVHINVSIDSPDPLLYQAIRGEDVQKAIRGLQYVMNAIDNPARVNVSSILMKQNLESLVAFPIILSKLGVKKYCLQSLIPHFRDLHHERLHHSTHVVQTLEQIEQRCQAGGITLEVSLPDRLEELRHPCSQTSTLATPSPNRTKRCLIPWEIPFIDKDGRIFPCSNAPIESTWIMGELRNKDFMDIWHGKPYQQFRRHLIEGGKALPAICRACIIPYIAEHPLRQYAARILFEQSHVSIVGDNCLILQNTGTAAWTHTTPLHIGTTHPRDRISIYYHPSWLSANRLATFIEEIVLPGECATFRFNITSVPEHPPEAFQCVIEGVCWLPGTEFELWCNSFNKSVEIFHSQEENLYAAFHRKIRKGKQLAKIRRMLLKDYLYPYAAKILLDQSTIRNQKHVHIVIQNSGVCYWTKESGLTLGMVSPQKRKSVYFHRTWLAPNRIARPAEEVIAPGKTATFDFQISPVSGHVFEIFQLHIDGKGWIPNTSFEICLEEHIIRGKRGWSVIYNQWLSIWHRGINKLLRTIYSKSRHYRKKKLK